MLRLISFLSQFRNTFLFVGLEAIALLLIVRANDHQRHIVGDSLLEVSGAVESMGQGVISYFNLKQENESLKAHNIELQQRLDHMRNQLVQLQSISEIDSLTSLRIEDTTAEDQFLYIPAQVIKNSTHKTYNYLTLDRGRMDSVEIDMGVVSSSGIVGRVINVSENYCLVQSALNVDFQLSLTAVSPDGGEPVGSIGFYEWMGSNTQRARLKYIPETEDLEEGFWVVTSGSSSLFPVGYKVGVIDKLEKGAVNGFFDTEMRLLTAFHKLSHVYIIKAREKAVFDSLEAGLPN